MATAKASTGLHALPMARIAAMVSILTGERVKKYKDKNTAVKALGNPSKQKLVLSFIKDGGATIEDIMNLTGASRAYARDIICKLVQKGEKIVKDEDKTFRFEA